MENHQDILQFIYINTDRAAKQVSTLSHGVVAPPFKSYLQELAQKYKQLGQTAEKHLTCTNTKATEIRNDGVLSGNDLHTADTVIYAVGQRALYEEDDELRFCAPEFYSVGDCNLPANIAKATKEGYYAARNIGRL